MELNKTVIDNLETNEPDERCPLRTETKKEDKPTTLKSRITSCVGNITVEPSMFLFILAGIIEMQMLIQNQSLEKACRISLNYTTEVCDGLRNQSLAAENEYEKNVQKFAAKYLGLRNLLTSTLPPLILLFMGSWSDKCGKRKCFAILAISGHIVANIFGVFSVYFFYQISLQVYIFVDAAITGITGSWCVLIATMFSYISSITSLENRTYRMGIVTFCMTVAFPIGMGLGGFLLKTYGFYCVYAVVLSIHSINYIYLTFVLNDPPKSKEQKEYYSGGFCNFIRTFFDISNLKECLTVVFKTGPNQRRLRICGLLFIVCLLFGPLQAEVAILYLSTRYRFNWDELMFSIFQSYNFVTHTVGTCFSIIVFSMILKWHDSVLGIISTASKIVAAFIYAFAINEIMFFAAPAVEILNGTSLLAMRSIVSKLVKPNEFGKVNSVFGVVENLMPLFYIPLYTRTYTATMHYFPGFIFLVGALLTLPALLAFCWLFYEHRRQLAREKVEISKSTETIRSS